MNPRQADHARKVLASELARAGTNATALSRQIERGKDYIRDFLSGRKESLGAGDVLAIERELGVSRAKLLGNLQVKESRKVPVGEEFAPDPAFEYDEHAEAAARAHQGKLAPGEVPERSVVASLGIGGTAEGVPIDGQVLDGVRAMWRLPPEFLRTELRSHESDVDFIAVDGDSMIPTLLPGDRVMINRLQNTPSPDGIYAIFD